MSDSKEVEFVLKVMANKQNNKLLFLEAGSDFTDVIFSFLTLPLGTIVRVLNQHYGDENAPPIIGSLTSLYNGVADLDSDNFLSEGCKAMLLSPRSSSEYECRQLKMDIKNGSFEPAKYFCCEDVNCVHYRRVNISMHYDAPVCRCGKSLKRELVIRDSCGNIDYGVGGGGGGGIFTVKRASFLLSGDMRVFPNVAGSVIKTLGNLGITDAEGAEPRNSTCRLNYIMSLLKDLLLTRMDSAAVKTEAGILFGEEEKEATRKSKKMVLNLMLQKSSNKLLFAQSEQDFIDFLFGLLVIPLGGVAFLLGGNTSLTKLDNLYQSVANINGDKYLINADIKK